MVQQGTLSVVVVDDNEDMRLLLRIQLEHDPRFRVVAEGADGYEAIAIVAEHQPDLLVLDRQMPRLGGVEAIPEIRMRAPATAIVLYTAHPDESTRRAALAAGAFEVVQKGEAIIDRLITTLAANEVESVHVRVGPVPARAAQVWVENTERILDALGSHPEAIDFEVPDDVLTVFRSFLAEWRAVAASAGDGEFVWNAQAQARVVHRLVEQWALIDALTDDQLRQLGVGWSPPEAQPFFEALTTGVLDALARNASTAKLSDRLRVHWVA